MDWARAIERNRDALSAIVAILFAMLGLSDGVTLGRIPHLLHRTVLRVLRPAESAVRRLIVIAARGLVVKPMVSRVVAKGSITAKTGGAKRPPAFPLFDTRKRFAHQRRKGPRMIPRITFMSVNAWGDPVFREVSAGPRRKPKPPDDGLIDATRLSRRLEALKLALADLPRQAKRLARARARRAKVRRLELQSPMRPGRPPGYRKKRDHEVDEVLVECHALARDVERLDTS